MIEQRVTLRYDAQQIPAIVQAVQGDTGRDVIFELADYEIPAGATANYYIDKPDGNAVYNSAEVISSTEILAHLTEQALVAPGRNNGQVRILADGEVITSFDFVLEVEAFRGLMRMQSETEVNIFDDAIQAAAEDAIQEILDQTPVVTGMQNSIAPSYDNTKTYDVGDYVMYNAQLYRCKIPITMAENWTAAHWIQVPITDDIKDISERIGYVDEFVGMDVLPLYKGKASVVDGEYSYNPSSNFAMYLPDTYGLSVKAGDMIVVTPMENTTLSGYIIYSDKVQLFSQKEYISGYVFQQDYDNIVINVGSTTSIANSDTNTGKITVYRIEKTKYIDIIKKKIAFLNDKQKLTNLFDGLYSNQLYDASTGAADNNNSEKYVSGINPIPVSQGDIITFDDFSMVFKRIYILFYGINGFISYKNFLYESGFPYSVIVPANTTYLRFEISFDDATNSSDVPIIGIYKNSIIKINGETSNIGLEMLGASQIPNSIFSSDLTFIDQYLCVFGSSSDDHTDYGPLEIMSVDFDNYTLTSSKTLHHNFGHCNTVDYCKETDTLILGNGGQTSNTEHNQIYIIKDATTSIINAAQDDNISLSSVALVIDINNAGLDWGKQLNVCWAYANHGKHDLAFAISNNGITQTIRLILLGRGQNELDYGTIISVGDDDFNGTFSIVNEWKRAYDTSIANQGTQYYKGHLYEAYGHRKIAFDKMTLRDDGSIHSEFITNPVFDGTGTEVQFDPEGCAIKNGVIFTGTMEIQSGSYPYNLRKISMFCVE